MIFSMLKIMPLPDKRQQIIEVLQSVQREVLLMHDCLLSEIYQTIDDRSIIFYLEQWQCKKVLHRHIESDLFMRVLTVMELAAEAPEISFSEVTEVRSMDLISALRELGTDENESGIE